MTETEPPRGETDDGTPRWQLYADERAQSVTLGAILVFGILVLALGIYQAFAVPAQNAEVEFKHSLEVQQRFQQLDGSIWSTALRGSGAAVQIPLGTTYPTRMLAINPPPPSGQLQTQPFGPQIQIANAVALDPEVDDYWNGTTSPTFPSSYGSYEPNYHAFSTPPKTIFANSVVYNAFENGQTVTISDQTLVQGRTITLVSLVGSLQASGIDSVTVSLQAASAPARTVPLRGAGSNPIEITIPTRLSVSQWETILEGQLDPAADPGNNRYVKDVTTAAGQAVTIVLEEGATYNARLAKVGVGSGVSGESPHYITVVQGDGGSVHEDGTREVVLEVRDRYNNPVSGVSVDVAIRDEGARNEGNISAQGQRGKVLTNLVTDEDGQITLTYQPWDVGGVLPVELRASFGGTPSRFGAFEQWALENASVRFNVTDNDQSPITPGLDATGQLVFRSSSVVAQSGTCPQGGNDPCYVNVSYTFENMQSTPITVTGIRLGYATIFDNTGAGQGAGSSSDDVRDGPTEITDLWFNGEPRAVSAVEASQPHFFFDHGQNNITIAAGATKSMYMRFDQGFVWGNNDGFALEVSLYTQSGLKGTYTVNKFN